MEAPGQVPAEGSGRTRRWMRADAPALLLFLALAALHTGLPRGLATRLYRSVDAWQDVWVLDWVSRHLLSAPTRVYEGNQFFPAPHSVLFCDPLLGPAALVAPLRLLSPGPVLVYNAAILATLTLSGYGFFLLARRLWGDTAGALLAGVLVPYAPVFLLHVQHLNLLTVTGYPFVMLGLLRLLERPSATVAVLTGLVLGLQAGTSGYHAFGLAFLCLTMTAWARSRLWTDRPCLLHWLATGLVGAAVVLPHALGTLALREESFMARDITEAAQLSLDLPGWLLASETLAWRGLLPGIGWKSLFPGLVPVILAALGLRAPRERTVWLLVAIGFVFFVLALGPDLQVFDRPRAPLPYRLLYEHVPLFDAVRHPVTFAGPCFMVLGLLAARGARSLGLSARPWLAGALLVLAVAETLTPWPARAEPAREMPEGYRLLQGLPPGPILELPFHEDRAQWWAMAHRRPTTAGKGAFEPVRYATLKRFVATEWERSAAPSLEDTRALAYLKHHFPVRYVVLHHDAAPHLRARFDAAPSFTLLAEAAGGARVYGLSYGGEGVQVRRRLTAEQLARPLGLVVEGPAGSRLRAVVNGSAAGEWALGDAPARFDWQVPEALVRRGGNEVHFGLDSGERFRLLDLRWSD
jgi:hypothetical protein